MELRLNALPISSCSLCLEEIYKAIRLQSGVLHQRDEADYLRSYGLSCQWSECYYSISEKFQVEKYLRFKFSHILFS